MFGYIVHDIDEIASVATGYGPAMDFFAEFIHGWGQARKKLDDHKITQEEYEE